MPEQVNGSAFEGAAVSSTNVMLSWTEVGALEPSAPRYYWVAGVSYDQKTEVTFEGELSDACTGVVHPVVSGYRIYRNDTLIATTPGTSLADTGLTPDTQYTYTIAALSSDDLEGVKSPGVAVTTFPKDLAKPAEVVALRVTARENGNITIVFSSVTRRADGQDMSGKVKEYRVERTPSLSNPSWSLCAVIPRAVPASTRSITAASSITTVSGSGTSTTS